MLNKHEGCGLGLDISVSRQTLSRHTKVSSQNQIKSNVSLIEQLSDRNVNRHAPIKYKKIKSEYSQYRQ